MLGDTFGRQGGKTRVVYTLIPTRNMMLAQLFEKSIILKYSAEPKGATAYLKTLYFPYTYTIIRASIWVLGYNAGADILSSLRYYLRV